MGEFYILDIPDQSIWEVVSVNTCHAAVRDGWIDAICVAPGTDPKAFIGQKLGIPAVTVFEHSDRYDVSKTPFPSTTTLSGDEKGGEG